MNSYFSQVQHKIGIALGSGAAKGWAHIGVLKALHEIGIEPAVVVGCSIGSFVGAAYANNNLNNLEVWVKDLSSWEAIKLLDVGIHKGGLIMGKKLFSSAQEMLGPRCIEESLKPFAAVATELYTGREIWLTQGNMRRAVRASCSMPGLLAPIRWQGEWVVDGAVVNPVPVSICRALGASYVIAVDLQSDRFSRSVNQAEADKYTGDISKVKNEQHLQSYHRFTQMFGVGNEYLNTMVEKLSAKSKNDPRLQPSMMAVMSGSLDILEEKLKCAQMADNPPDVVIAPKLADIGLMEFFRAEEAIEQGYQAVQRVLPQLELCMK